MDLSPFYARYREDGWGRAAYDPAMMVAIVLYAYCKGQRSSRGIERACVEDVAYRVIAANLAPDHVTIDRFRQSATSCAGRAVQQRAQLVRGAGMVKVGMIADRRHEGACERRRSSNADYEQIAREILEEAAEDRRRRGRALWG